MRLLLIDFAPGMISIGLLALILLPVYPVRRATVMRVCDDDDDDDDDEDEEQRVFSKGAARAAVQKTFADTCLLLPNQTSARVRRISPHV